MARRSQPLIEAIDRFEREHGEPPASLEALVPAYLSSVPGTGMAAYPAYRYRVGQRAERFGDNAWALEVFTPSGILNFDSFVYYPNQNYQNSCMGWVERVGDWAYLHE